jgi:hypothetical protein
MLIKASACKWHSAYCQADWRLVVSLSDAVAVNFASGFNVDTFFRWTVIYLAKVFIQQLFNLATNIAETTDFQIMVEQILGLLVSIL